MNFLDICEPFDFIGEKYWNLLRGSGQTETATIFCLQCSSWGWHFLQNLSSWIKNCWIGIQVTCDHLKLNDPGIKQWGDGSQSHQGWLDRKSSQSEASTGCNWPIRRPRDVIITSHVRGPIVLFPVQPLRAIFKWPSSEFVSEIFHCLNSYLIHFNWIVTCRFLTISSELWKKFWWWRGGWIKSTFVRGMMLSHSWIGD